MIKKWRIYLYIMSVLVMCPFITACGESEDDTVVGDDWRVSGDVVGSGTITHDGESVDVLVTVDGSSAAFYWDEPEQVLFDSVLFPVTVPGAGEYFNDISFDDIDGDGESDVCVSFVYAPGESTQLVWIWDPVERYVFREDLSHINGEKPDEYVGIWKYQDENLWLRIYDDSTWEFVDGQDAVIEHGTLWVDENGVTLNFDGSGDVLRLDRTVSGDLIDTVNSSILMPADSIQSDEPYFSGNGLDFNAVVEEGTFLLQNGVCSYSGLGDGYNTADCYWEVIKSNDYIHDGIREIQFDAICYIPDSSIPYFDQQYITNTDSELYDFYSGMWLTAASSYGNSSRGDNYYLHTVNQGVNSYLIEFAYSTDWRYDVGDWAAVLTKSYIVYLPEDYDGLVFAAEAQPDNYRDCAKRMQLDSISPEAEIMDIDTVDPYSSLYFNICD